MVNSSLFQQVVKNLEEHEKSLRIKKLIYCICTNRWENDKNKLNNISWSALVQELRKKHPTLEQLKFSLARVVKTLSKPEEYSLVAKIIYGNVGRLYPEAQNLRRENNPAVPVPSANQQMSKVKEKSKSENASATQMRRKAYDSFAVRLEIMNYTNPLRAKILLFSTLYHPFEFSNQDWLSLKTHGLDDLLQKMFRDCKSITDLEAKLYRTAKSLKEPNENTKAASAIVQSIKPFYPEPSQDDEEPTTVNPDADIRGYSAGVIDDDDDLTCQLSPS